MYVIARYVLSAFHWVATSWEMLMKEGIVLDPMVSCNWLVPAVGMSLLREGMREVLIGPAGGHEVERMHSWQSHIFWGRSAC